MEFRTSIPGTLGWAALVVVATLVSYFAARSDPVPIQVAGWLGVALCALLLVFLLLQLLRRGPTVVIDDSGVLDVRLGVGTIAWGDISSVSITQLGHQRCISLWLRNEDQYLSRASSLSASLSRFGEQVEGLSPFRLKFAGLTPGLDEAYARLRTRIPERAGV